MKNKTLIAGPWVGEFGWELFAWQGYIRSLARNFDKTVIISRTLSKELYSDFCDEFYSFDKITGLADSFFMHDMDLSTAFKSVIQENNIPLKNTTVCFPRRIGFPPETHYEEQINFGDISVKPKYITFGKKNDIKYDYVFHIRNRQLRKEDNWSIENWKKLAKSLNSDRIVCVGTKRESGWLEGTIDARDKNLKEVFDILRNTKCAFGPSSGPMHLASLCGCPHIVWSKKENRTRYKVNWNPLQTPVLFLDEYSWHPSAEYIYQAYKRTKFNYN